MVAPNRAMDTWNMYAHFISRMSNSDSNASAAWPVECGNAYGMNCVNFLMVELQSSDYDQVCLPGDFKTFLRTGMTKSTIPNESDISKFFEVILQGLLEGFYVDKCHISNKSDGSRSEIYHDVGWGRSTFFVVRQLLEYLSRGVHGVPGIPRIV